tara:strand:- start:189 stop:680 length:492 start_codon:yes stop_codon:yes gene_type:complete
MEIPIEVLECMEDIIKKVEQKEKRRLYYLENKEKIKLYQLENKEKINEKIKLYRLENKEKIKERDRLYRLENKEKKNEKDRLYRQTPKGIKSRRISQWKHNGLICNDINELYNLYCRTAYCDNCKVELTYDKKTTATTKCMDHDHETGLFRNILCNYCNLQRG